MYFQPNKRKTEPAVNAEPTVNNTKSKKDEGNNKIANYVNNVKIGI